METRIVIVGTRHRGTEAMDALAALTKGAPISLRREPDNAFDPGAVACYAGNTHLGYPPRAQYGSIRDALDAGNIVEATLTSEAIIDNGDIVPGGAPRLTVSWGHAHDVGPNQNDGPADFSEGN